VLLASGWARTGSRLTAVALGLIIGGAVGNGIDPFVHTRVADFVLFHITTQTDPISTGSLQLRPTSPLLPGVVGLLV